MYQKYCTLYHQFNADFENTNIRGEFGIKQDMAYLYLVNAAFLKFYAV
jgi:hypothetical protein